MSSKLWYPDVDLARLMQFRRDAGLSLAACICWTDGFFQLLPSVVDAFVDVQHSGYTLQVVGNPGNLELRNVERRGMARLAFNDVSFVGLVGDVDAARNGTVCASHLGVVSEET